MDSLLILELTDRTVDTLLFTPLVRPSSQHIPLAGRDITNFIQSLLLVTLLFTPPVRPSSQHIPLAGRDITNFIQTLMRERENGMPADEAMEVLCY